MFDRVAWLTGDLMVMAGPAAAAQAEEPATSTATVGDRQLEVESQSCVLANGDASGVRTLTVSRFRGGLDGPNPDLTLRWNQDDPLTIGSLHRDHPAVLLREEIGRLDPPGRRQALRFLWSAVSPRLGELESYSIARLLADLNQELRPALPPMFRTSDEHNAAHVDVVLMLDERAIWAQGWMHDRGDSTARLTVLAPEGGRAELLPGLFRHARRDMEEVFQDKEGVKGRRHGFARFAELDGPSYVSNGWLLELETSRGEVGERNVPPVISDPIGARERILPYLRYERRGTDELMRSHVHPAMTRIQEGLRDAAGIESVVQFGEPPARPEVSIIVPLYTKLWFLEYQMAQWAEDPEVGGADLIYVLDSPEQAVVLDELAHGLYSIYGIPYRLAVMKGNSGFAMANNRASELARADKLLLLNSDVVPAAPGWLGRMSAFHEATPDIGALGAKLIYEDDSIQHAGIYFDLLPGSPRTWENMHYFKGQHRSLPAANVARQVPAVTGACMMIEREQYERAGGLSHRFVQGGYEDSDFCLRLLGEGRQHWYMPGAELYHMENQSYPKQLRAETARYNRWLQTELWGDHLGDLMAEYPSGAQT